MIYREYETGHDDFSKKVEYRISVTTDSFGVYSAMKNAIESLAEQAEMPYPSKGGAEMGGDK